MANDQTINDDEASYLQQQIENEEYEYWIFMQEKKEHDEYLEILAKGE